MFLEVGLLLLRLTVGSIILAHGAQKLFGWFGGSGIQGTTKMMERLHLNPPRPWAYVSALNEVVGGLLVAVGLLMPLGPIMIVANMLVAMVTVHGVNGFWNTQGGYEYNVVLGAAALALALTGAGYYSLDNALGIVLPEPQLLGLALAALVVGFAIMVLSLRRVAVVGQEAKR